MPGKSPILFFQMNRLRSNVARGLFPGRPIISYSAALKPAYENFWWMRGGGGEGKRPLFAESP